MAAEISRMERKKAKTKEMIYETALQLFIEKGFDNTTVDEIAAKADIAKGTFFNYFPRKEAVLMHMAEIRMEQLYRNLPDILDGEASAWGRIEKMMHIFGKINEKEKSLTKVVVLETFKNLATVMGPEEKEKYIQFPNLLRDILRQGQERGEIREWIDVDTAARTLEFIYMSTLLEWVDEDQCLVDTLLKRMKYVFYGILTQ
ncbi:MAG: TetR/AcrR family transcriptional regulator [Bacillota bacterium]